MTAAKPILGPPVDPAPAQLPQPVILSGRFGSVRPLDAKRDASGLWEQLRGHDEVWTYMSVHGPFADRDTFAAWLDSREALKETFSYTVHDTAGRTLGVLCLMEVRPAMRVIEVGAIVYSPALQRTPLGTETQYLLARYVFETLGYRRYEWKCNALNAASRRAALRYGFAFEGILRQHMIVKGHSRDTAYYSMLDSEWPARRRNFERWLAAENFAGDGRQKKSLADLNGETA